MARLLGAAKVVGSAGSPEKVAWVTGELGFDAAFDYHDGPVSQLLKEHAPIDVYFDNVGGEHLEAAISAMADFGRVAACGAIATYNETDPSPGRATCSWCRRKRLSIRGFIVLDHGDVTGEFYRTRRRVVRRREAGLPGDDRRRARRARSTRSSTCTAAPTSGRCWSGSELADASDPRRNHPVGGAMDVGRSAGRLVGTATSVMGVPRCALRRPAPGGAVSPRHR